MKRTVLFALSVSAILMLGLSTIATAEKLPTREYVPSNSLNPSVQLLQPLVFKQGGDTAWLQVHTTLEACACDPDHGSECDGGPTGEETFCFEMYGTNAKYAYYGSDGTPYFSEAGGNGFQTIDTRTLGSSSGEDFWHLDSYQAYGGTGYSWWCGAMTGDRCKNWDYAPGYGDRWNQLLIFQPELPQPGAEYDVRLECAVRYDTECDYDYAYIEYTADGGSTWTPIATLNGTSRGTPPQGTSCPSNCGGDYFTSGDCNRDPPTFPKWNLFPINAVDGEVTVTDPNNFLVGFRFESDGAWSDRDSRGDTDGALFVDNVSIYDAVADTLIDFQDMDSNFRPEDWWIGAPSGVANHWWMAYDPDPPTEGALCQTNASWCWTACPYVNNKWRIPPESNGFYYRLMSPKIYTGWGEPYAIPKEYAGLYVQYDMFICMRESSCDFLDTQVNVYDTSPVSGNPGWCGWTNIDGYITYGGCDFMNLDDGESVAQFMSADVDSVCYSWDCLDIGATGDFCWTTIVPKPHRQTQIMVDNVSFGIYDASASAFTARAIDILQDSFDLETDAHNALLANGDLPKDPIAWSESLVVDIVDPNGLDGVGAYVHLMFSVDGGGSWSFTNMVNKVPNETDPDIGGTYIGSISAMEALGQATWIPGTVVHYYIEVNDNDNNKGYWPASAAPTADPAVHTWTSNYLEFTILPGLQAKGGDRLLLVDDFGRSRHYFHSAMADTQIWSGENFYESVLTDLGYCYDKYDVGGASTGLTNEPWDIVLYPDPQNPDSVILNYDALIWFNSTFSMFSVLDTMQCRLVDFVKNGGHLFICGNNIGQAMTNRGLYDDDAEEDCDFYSGLCGAFMSSTNPESSPGIEQPHQYAIGTGVATSGLTDQDTFHFHMGCPAQWTHDITYINTSPPAWAPNPQAYLAYHNGYSPGDTLVAIYNEYTDGGKVVYCSYDLTMMVDSALVTSKVDPLKSYEGRSELLKDVLANLFGISANCGADVADDSPFVPPKYAYSLSQNHPNPFNPDTYVNYSIRDAGRVNLKVYNVRGQVVKTLVDRKLQPGQYQAHWDGTNENGYLVSSGIYFCKMEANDFRATKKMILLK